MITKKIFGYLFIVISTILTLAIIIVFPQFIKAISGILKSGSDSYEIGYNVGYIIFSIIHIIITFILWRIGIRWIKKSST